MQISDEIIKVLEYLCGKLGVTVDWTSENIMPYIQTLCQKLVNWEIATSIAWIVIAIIAIIVSACLLKFDWDGGQIFIFVACLIFGVLIIGNQTFDIIQGCVFPEKTIYEYVSPVIRNMN